MDTKVMPTGRIQIKLRKVSQLFNTLDPSPFRESERALEAEHYIVARALELPIDVPLEIIVHLPSDELSRASSSDIVTAMKDHFELRSRTLVGEMQELFRTGRLLLAVSEGGERCQHLNSSSAS
jgi:hypothetical protein